VTQKIAAAHVATPARCRLLPGVRWQQEHDGERASSKAEARSHDAEGPRTMARMAAGACRRARQTRGGEIIRMDEARAAARHACSSLLLRCARSMDLDTTGARKITPMEAIHLCFRRRGEEQHHRGRYGDQGHVIPCRMTQPVAMQAGSTRLRGGRWGRLRGRWCRTT
jgi:hypothetical protein